VTFELEENGEGKPLASSIRVLIEGDARGRGRLREMAMNLGGKEMDWGKTYTGRIVRLFREAGPLPASWAHKVPGLCFIACEETYRLFEHDIWAYPSQVMNRKIGDMLSFKVRLDHWWNYPVAYEIRYLPELDKPSKDGQAAPRLRPGAAVRLCGIRSTPALNGVCGTLKYCRDDVAKRWVVKLEGGYGSKIVKPGNLEVLATEGPAAQAQQQARRATARPTPEVVHAADLGAGTRAGSAPVVVQPRAGLAQAASSSSAQAAYSASRAAPQVSVQQQQQQWLQQQQPLEQQQQQQQQPQQDAAEQHAQFKEAAAAHPRSSSSTGGGGDGGGAEAVAAATTRAAGGGAGAQVAQDSTGKDWQKFLTEEGKVWWYCEATEDFFMEEAPGSWRRCFDEASGHHYWWKTDGTSFWTL